MASQFSKDGKYFAQLSTQGKLKIWETANNSFEQEYTPDYHLTSPCTCLHFVDHGSTSSNKNVPPRKKKRRDSHSSVAPSIILGTSSGSLLVYSLVKADLDYTINSDIGQAITCLSWQDGNSVYSAAEQHVLCWDLVDKRVKSKWKGGNEKISAVLIIPDSNNILTASKIIKMWDVQRKTILRTFTGHSHEVSFMHFISPNNLDAYFVSASKGDRSLSFWNLSDVSSEKNAVANFLMEDIAVSVSVIVGTDSSTSMAVVTKSGVVHVYQHTLNGKCSKPIKPKKTIQVVSDTGQKDKSMVVPIPIFNIHYNEDLSLLTAYGSSILLTFENVVLNDYEKVQCLIRQDPKLVATTSNENKISKTQSPAVENNVHYLTPHTSNGATAVKRRGNGSLEVPMEQRLENLTLNKLDGLSKVPKINNVAQLLVQGLHSKDKNILKSVLHTQDESVIKNTVKRLPMPVIVPFVQELTSLIQEKTQLSQIGSMWLKNLLQAHAGILLSNPNLSDLLVPIIGSIESRLTLQTPLNRLYGRLNLLVTQISVATSQETSENDEALLIYDDKESSDSEPEVLDVAHSESDNEWMEESSEDEEMEDNNDAEVQSDEQMSS